MQCGPRKDRSGEIRERGTNTDVEGDFSYYVCSMRRASNVDGLYCRYSEDTAEHTLFDDCPHWEPFRSTVGAFSDAGVSLLTRFEIFFADISRRDLDRFEVAP
ncbi:Hypothetical protein CINCED_3A011432 [Cinara cedri]|uniref:Uncharacterized protein n=1 Tax=Cinara cedri TaxID=506608 RepID=A0A5E4M9J4_9HEMI|nr:Hypothetical protein CINCED_3A011432 [Cinara cedri]